MTFDNPQLRPRAREAGIVIGDLPTGALNAITDVPGIRVGSVYEGIVQYMVDDVFRSLGHVPWFNPVVGETSDAFLNDIVDERGGTSIMIIFATDLPLSGGDLDRVAKRATFGLARTGSNGGHGSGDYVIGFSTTWRQPDRKKLIRSAMRDNESLIDKPFVAIAEATEEAILNSLFKATTIVGRDGHVRQAMPVDEVLQRWRVAKG